MSEKKIITVFGATGAQGGGLAHAILADKNSEFAVRAVTRDTQSDKARELEQLGAEVIAGDDSPDNIMLRYNRATLEEVFLDVARGRVQEVAS